MTNKIRGWNLRLLGNAWWKKCGHETTSAFSVLIVIPACLYCVCIVSAEVCVWERVCWCVSISKRCLWDFYKREVLQKELKVDVKQLDAEYITGLRKINIRFTITGTDEALKRCLYSSLICRIQLNSSLHLKAQTHLILSFLMGLRSPAGSMLNTAFHWNTQRSSDEGQPCFFRNSKSTKTAVWKVHASADCFQLFNKAIFILPWINVLFI